MLTVQRLPIDELQQQAHARLDAARQAIALLRSRALREAVVRGHDAREQAAALCDDPLGRWADALVARGVPTLMRARLDSLRAWLSAPPLADLDEQTAKALAATVAEMPLWQVEAIRRHEAAHKARVTVLRACEARLGVAA